MDKAGETLEREGTRKAGGSLADFSQRGGAAVDAAPLMDGGRGARGAAELGAGRRRLARARPAAS